MKDRIIAFLTSNNIPFKTAGDNVSKNSVAIKCPLCGEADLKEHCNINFKNGYFFCWRDRSHKGSFSRLVKIITGKWGEVSTVVDDTKLLKLLVKNKEEKQQKKNLSLDFTRSLNDFSKSSLFNTHLIRSRGFAENEIKDLVDIYNLRGTNCGKWSWRIIFPLTLGGDLISYLGRSINESTLPYLELSVELSIIPPKEFVFNFDSLSMTGGKCLFITEGVFDALKVDFYSPEYIRSTSLFTKNLKSKNQMILLSSLATKFDMFCILLDRDAFSNAFSLQQELSILNIPTVICRLPDGVSDPGELSREGVDNLLKCGGFYG